MLVSTDWFVQLAQREWSNLSGDQGEAMMLRARKAVKAMLGRNRLYEYVSLDPLRVDATRAAFLDLLEEFAGATAFAAACCAAIRADRSFQSDRVGAFELSYLNAGLLQNVRDDIGDDLGADLKPKVFRAIRESAMDRDFEKGWMASSSAWDARVRASTPDQPTLMADLMTTVVVPEIEIARFRRELLPCLSADEVERLQTWYEAEAMEVGMPFHGHWKV